MAKQGISIGKIRSALYGTAKILGDVNSVKIGTIGQRITNRATGKARDLSQLNTESAAVASRQNGQNTKFYFSVAKR